MTEPMDLTARNATVLCRPDALLARCSDQRDCVTDLRRRWSFVRGWCPIVEDGVRGQGSRRSSEMSQPGCPSRDVPAGMAAAAAAVALSAPPERVASRCLISMAPCSKVIGWKVVTHNYIEGAVTTTKPCQTSRPREVSAGNKITPDVSTVLAWACLCRMLPRTRFLAHGHRDS